MKNYQVTLSEQQLRALTDILNSHIMSKCQHGQGVGAAVTVGTIAKALSEATADDEGEA